jgi:kynurenine formamidase
MQPASAIGARPSLDLATARIVDLTHPLDADTIFWPGDRRALELVEDHNGLTEGGFFYAANHFCMPEHGGTHVDAPYHFNEHGAKIGALCVERLIAPAVVVDICAKAAADPDYRLQPDDVAAWEAMHGTVPAGAIVLLRTGWSRRWPDKRAYLGNDTPGDARGLHFPSYGEAAARLLAGRGVSVLGVDTASVDHGPAQDFPVHRVLGAAGIIGLENLNALEHLPPAGAWVAALPINLADGTGAPARVVAFLP